MRNSSADGYSSFIFANSSDVPKVYFGYANSSASDSILTAKGFLNIVDDFVVKAASKAAVLISSVTGAFKTGAGRQKKCTTVTTNTTLDGNYHHIFVDATAGNVTITLPTLANSVTSDGCGFEFVIHRVDASGNTVTVDGNGSETLNGVASIDVNTQYSTLKVIARSAATGWYTF